MRRNTIFGWLMSPFPLCHSTLSISPFVFFKLLQIDKPSSDSLLKISKIQSVFPQLCAGSTGPTSLPILSLCIGICVSLGHMLMDNTLWSPQANGDLAEANIPHFCFLSWDFPNMNLMMKTICLS